MLSIAFATQIGPASGPAQDGVIFGALPQVAAVSALSSTHIVPFTSVYRGNAAADGSVTWSDVTAAASSDAANDVSLFDTINPTADRLCIELEAAGERSTGIATIDFSVSAGDPIVVVQPIGSAGNNLADGTIYLWRHDE